MFLHYTFDVLDHDDGVVDHDADGEYTAKGYGVGRVTDRLQDDEDANQAHRHRDRRNEGGAHAAEEQEDNDDDEVKASIRVFRTSSIVAVTDAVGS